MKKILTAIILSASMLLTACGAAAVYDLAADKELSNAAGATSEQFLKTSLQPFDDTTDSGNYMSEIYYFRIGGDMKENYDRIDVSFQHDKIGSIGVRKVGSGGNSGYTLFGLRLGDSKSTVEAAAKNKLGDEGTWTSDTDPKNVKAFKKDTGTFTSDKGTLLVSVDTQTDTVVEMSLYFKQK